MPSFSRRFDALVTLTVFMDMDAGYGTDEWIGQILFSPAVQSKLATKHNVHPWQVKQAVACGAHDTATWHDHPVYGERLILTGSGADKKPMIVYLRPIDREDGLWECLSAYRMGS